MTIISVVGGNSQEILDGSQDTLSFLAITAGTGLVHVGDPSPAGFDVPFRGGDQIILPANEPATLRADGFIVTGSIGAYGGQIYSGGGTPEPFWNPFTITTGEVSNGDIGYEEGVGGSITNQPVDGYTVVRAVNQSGSFILELSGPNPIASDALVNAVIGINAEDYSPSSVSSFANSGGEWVTAIEIEDVTEWTVIQQVPIVIIPQNG